MRGPLLSIDLSGPLFAREPGQTIHHNIRRMLEGIAEEGEETVKAAYPVVTGRGRAGVRGRVESLTGKQWALTAVISQTFVYPWPGGGPKQYRGGKTERRHGMFRRTAQALRASREVLGANLTEGLD